MDMRVRGGDEPAEQRMRLVRLAVEFGMKLARDKKRMVGQFDDLDQFSVRRIAAENEIRLGEPVAVGVVEFVAVTVPFVDDERPVKLRGLAAHHELARLRDENEKLKAWIAQVKRVVSGAI